MATIKHFSKIEYEHADVWFDVVNEAHTALSCSVCKSRTGSTGLEGLGIRECKCGNCHTVNQRDINSAKNILALWHERLAEGIPRSLGCGGCQCQFSSEKALRRIGYI